MEREVQLTCTPSRSRLPALREEMVLYLLLEIFPSSEEGEGVRLPLDICLIMDISSSMRGERIFHAREAARYLVNQLTSQDYFSLITFNDRAQLLIPRQPVRTPASAREHLSSIQASGGTEMARGLELAWQQLRQSGAFGGIRRVILITDGRTYGDDDRCVELARQIQGTGVGITTVGLGDDWNEDLLATISAHGSGRSEYLPGPEEIQPFFQEELRLLQGILAQEMSLSLRPAQQTQVKTFFRVAPEVFSIPLKEDWQRGQVILLGEWMGMEPQVFLTEMVLSPLPVGEHDLLEISLSYLVPLQRMRRTARYSLHLPVQMYTEGSGEIPLKVRRALERITAYRLQETAWQEAHRGNVDRATRRLEAAATRLVELGEVDLARAVEQEAARLKSVGRPSAAGKKEIHYGTRRLGRRWFGWQREERGKP